MAHRDCTTFLWGIDRGLEQGLWGILGGNIRKYKEIFYERIIGTRILRWNIGRRSWVILSSRIGRSSPLFRGQYSSGNSRRRSRKTRKNKVRMGKKSTFQRFLFSLMTDLKLFIFNFIINLFVFVFVFELKFIKLYSLNIKFLWILPKVMDTTIYH